MKHHIEMRTEAGGVLDTWPLGEPDTYGDFFEAVLDCLKKNRCNLQPGDILEIKEEA